MFRYNFLINFLITTVICALSDESNFYPIYAGGSEHEFVNCFTMDGRNDLIIVGGNTTSDDFGPSSDAHGFLYALDLQGNWQWGNFYSASGNNQVSDITGC